MCLFLTPANKQINYVRALLQTTDADNCDNYRPISVLPTLSKIVERAAHIQLYNHLDSNGLLHVKQFGFRRKRSTSNALHVLQFSDDILQNMEDGLVTGVVFSRLKESLQYGESLRPLAQAVCLGSGRLSCSMVQIILNESVPSSCYPILSSSLNPFQALSGSISHNLKLTATSLSPIHHVLSRLF